VRTEEAEAALDVEVKSWNGRDALLALQQLFPAGLPVSIDFYLKLRELAYRIGFQDAAAKVLGLIWSEAIRTLDTTSQESLLAALPAVEDPDFFQILPALPTLVSECPLEPAFVAQWFPALLDRVGDDFASDGFWTALEIYTERYPQASLAAIDLLAPGHTESQISVAASLLGHLRAAALPDLLSEAQESISTRLRDHLTVSSRAVYFRSWLPTARRKGISPAQFTDLISLMSAGLPEEKDACFGLVGGLLRIPGIPPACFDVAQDWLSRNAHPALSSHAKYHIVNLAAAQAHDGRFEIEDTLLSILPIPTSDRGTWGRLEAYLVSKLRADESGFSTLCLAISESSAADWLIILKTPQCFDWLLSEMKHRQLGNLIGLLLFSADSAPRKLGFYFFEKLPATRLPATAFEELPEAALQRTFHEYQITYTYQGEAIAAFLRECIPHISRYGPAIESEWYEELQLQMRNFGGACGNILEPEAAKYPILQRLFTEVSEYRQALTALRSSSIAQMHVPGSAWAQRLAIRRLSSAIQKGAEEHSSILKLFKTVRLLYGRQWRNFSNGHLGATGDLKQIFHTSEFPRMEIIDPETMAFRRHHAFAMLDGTSSR